jgi:hypothetical protein
MRLFLPSPRQTNFLIILGFAAAGAALYTRHAIIDSSVLAAACADGSVLAGCWVRRFIVELGELQFFGGAALVAAILHFLRPRVTMFAGALTAAVFGLLLGNPEASAFATAIIVLAFARPVRASKPAPAPAAPLPPAPPASSKTIH